MTITLERKALEEIKGRAYYLALSDPFEERARKIWDIFWLAQAALEGREKAAALDTFSALSGISADDPARTIMVEEEPSREAGNDKTNHGD